MRLELTKTGESKNKIISGFVQDKEILDLEIVHKKPSTSSQITVLYVVEGGELFLRAKIRIEQEAREAKALLDIRVLLLNKNAKVRVLPQLEIMNKDVVCTHSTTISGIKQEEAFYLKTRGLTDEQIKDLFINSFLSTNI